MIINIYILCCRNVTATIHFILGKGGMEKLDGPSAQSKSKIKKN